ncbi:MAG: EAL domain-containing protein [Thermodesulfobacteriota bacterium]
MTDEETFRNIILEQRIRIFLQPIISIKEKRVIGFEALTRGIDPETGEMVPPIPLFQTARRMDRALEFDRLCRKTAVKDFLKAELNLAHMLFINFDPSILADVTIGNGWMRGVVEEEGLNPANVAIEIVESPQVSTKDLVHFVELYKRFGFLIVLDDFGARHSNLDRILSLKPDILKIDRELIDGVGRDYYKQSIVASISDLAGKIGTLVLAEGVEAVEDIIKCYELGVNLFQGYYFARPAPPDRLLDHFCTRSIHHVSRGILHHLKDHITLEMETQQAYNTITWELCAELSRLFPDAVNGFLKDSVDRYDQIQCLYVLDPDGRQISHTHCKFTISSKSDHPLFKPSAKGTDHSLKSYFYYLQILKLDTYFSDPYTSLATGCICRTMSAVYRGAEGAFRILCVDFNV